MLAAGYYFLSLVLVLVIIIGYRKAGIIAGSSSKSINRSSLLILILTSGWFVYLWLIQQSNLLQDNSLPPKMPLFLFLPFIIFTVVFYRKNRNNEVLKAMPKSWLVYIQSFRIVVELLILFTFFKGILPLSATFEGYNFDILMGLTAPLIAYFLFRIEVKHLWLAKAYNLFGIGMILFVAFIVATSFYQPQMWGSEVPLVSNEFFTYPYLLLPGFLAPMGIFFHVVSLLQLRGK